MKLSQLTSAQLGELSKLVALKEKLQAELHAVESKLENLGATGGSGAKRRGRPPGKPAKASGAKRGPKKGSKPGYLKAKVVEALKSAGAAGLTIKELAAKVGSKPNNLNSWFYTTGKKVAKKLGDGKYALTGK